MKFNSFLFVGLVLITFLLYYAPLLKKYQVRILIAASLVFYAWHSPILLFLLLGSALINIVTSHRIAHKKGNPKLTAWVGVGSNLSILAFFKYAGLLSTTLFGDGSISEILLAIPLPIGISFFTFQGISLVVDVYQEKHFRNAELIPNSLYEHGKNTLFYIAFFPQLVAGPIVKAHDFLPQIKPKFRQDILWETCFKEIILGYFLKMVVADNLKDLTFWIKYPFFNNQESTCLVTMLFGYSCQIFADFAGYSLIAIGIARLFGYNLPDNFNFPYIASSFKEFWKRWHISLSSFLQEYLYIPLGGNKKGRVRTYINLMITMILGGLWHGAAWSYAVWGAFHGILLASERLLSHKIQLPNHPIIKALKIIFVFLMVSLGWLLFKLPVFSEAIAYLQAIGKNTYLPVNMKVIVSIFIYSTPVVIYHLWYLLRPTLRQKLTLPNLDYVVYGTMIFLILTSSGTPGTFIYFQF